MESIKKQVHILVVDDEDVIRNLLYDVLTHEGYNVKAVSSGKEAIEKITQRNFSIVITDLKMPGMSGTEVLRKLKTINSDIFVIVITAYPSIESVIKTMQEGAYDYIIKPFNINDIKLVVRKAAEKQYLLHEAGPIEYYRELSILDSLTGVYNRRHFYEVLPREIERARRYKYTVCLLMIDLDDSGEHIDTHEHLVEDKLLQGFSEFLVGKVRAGDMIFRYKDNGFAVICPETTKQGGEEFAKRLLNLAKQNITRSISIGLSCFPDDADNKDNLIKRCDETIHIPGKEIG